MVLPPSVNSAMHFSLVRCAGKRRLVGGRQRTVTSRSSSLLSLHQHISTPDKPVPPNPRQAWAIHHTPVRVLSSLLRKSGYWDSMSPCHCRAVRIPAVPASEASLPVPSRTPVNFTGKLSSEAAHTYSKKSTRSGLGTCYGVMLLVRGGVAVLFCCRSCVSRCWKGC